MQRFWQTASFLSLVLIGVVFVKSLSGPLNIDFTMFWTAKELAYPPSYLLLIEPLALLPYGPAFAFWVVLTGALYIAAAPKPKAAALANPAATFNGMIGQNGFLTAAIMLFGLRQLSHKPALGGAILGLLIIKPHLALVLPVAVIAMRAWRAVPAALASMTLLCIASLILLGWEAYERFFEFGARYGSMLREGVWNWPEIASFYSFARWCGANDLVALGLHSCVAAAALAAVWLAWRNDIEGKIPLTAAASILVSPYLFTYDAVVLTAPLAWLRNPRVVVLAWVLTALPLLRVFVQADCPNTIPLAAALCVYAVVSHTRILPQSRLATESSD